MAKLARLLADDDAFERRDRAAGALPRLRTRYYAFLSYSHKDKGLAEWLHRELEAFRVPSSLAGRLTAHGVVPRRLTPIFRDQHELSAGADLAEEIEAALAASQFLIVLCSPTAATSRWTNAEIESFKRTRPEGCVLAAVISGEPFASEVPGREAEECFPPALRFKYDRRGRQTAKRAEPLAADFRTGGEGRRRAFLKLVAGMLGVGLDDLVQREQTRRHRQLAWLAAASLTGMAVTSTLAVTAIHARDEAREQRREAEGLVGFMLGDLKDKLEPIGRLDALDAVGSRALAYYQHQDKASLSDAALAQRSKALTMMGEIATTRGDLDGALRRYREALASTGEAMRRYPNDPQRVYDHAENVFYVGYIPYMRGNLDEAAARFREYQVLANRMVQLAPDKKEYRLEQVMANTNLGAVLVDQSRYREAAATYTASLGVAESLAAAEPRNTDYQKRVSNHLAWLADAHEYSGAIDQALGERERQLRLLAELRRSDPRDTELQRDAVAAHRAMGRLLASRGDSAAALKEALAAVAIADDLFRIEPENTEWLQANASARFDLADLQLASGAKDAGAATTRAECDIADRLVGRDESVTNWRSRLRANCLELGSRIALAAGRPDDALNLARQSLSAAQTSAKVMARDILMFRALALGGDALAAAGRRDQAIQWWTAATRSIARTAELRPTDQGILAAIKLRLGDRDGAHQLMSSLAAMGYRHPGYLAAVRAESA